MRIAFIAGEYPPLQGGLGDYTRELAHACALAGHAPHVLTRAVAGAPAHEDARGVHAHRLVTAWGWRSLLQLNHFLAELRPDVLNLQYQAAAYSMHPAVNLLPRLFAPRVPVVVTFHDLRVPYLFPKAGPLRWRSILDMAHRAHAVVVTNAEDYETLHRAQVSGVTLIPIGSNIEPAPLWHFDRAEWLRARGIDPAARLIGYFGFMNESKGGETLIRAMAELRQHSVNAVLLLIGGQTGASDPTNIAYARHILQVADGLGVRQHIAQTGYLDQSGVSEALAACDCIALPYRDGASFRRGTLMAALAHGCAIVTTTPRVALPDLRDTENVLLVPPDSPSMLANAILRVLDSTELCSQLRAGSRRTSELFTWDRIAAQTTHLFDQTCH